MVCLSIILLLSSYTKHTNCSFQEKKENGEFPIKIRNFRELESKLTLNLTRELKNPPKIPTRIKARIGRVMRELFFHLMPKKQD